MSEAKHGSGQPPAGNGPMSVKDAANGLSKERPKREQRAVASQNKNDRLTDAQLLQAILVLAFAERLGRGVIGFLNDSEPRIAALIRNTRTGLASAADFRRMNKLLSAIRKERGKVWRAIEREVMFGLKKLAREQPRRMKEIVEEVEGEEAGIELPLAALLASITEDRKLEGRTIREWLSKQREDDDARISNQVRFGLISNEPPDKITRRVFGEARVLGANGATEEARRRLYEIVILGGLFTANESKREFVLVNEGIFPREIYLAILDDRTTAICRSLNRRVFRVGEGPTPPLHWWCRSIRVFLLPGALPATLTSLGAWLASQPKRVRRLVEESRAQRFKRS